MSDRVQMALNIRNQLLARKSKTSPSKTNNHIEDELNNTPEKQAEGLNSKNTSESGPHPLEDSDIGSESRLIIDECSHEKEDEDMENEDEEDDSTDNEEHDSNTDSNHQTFMTGQHNLETLAAVASLEKFDGENGKSKRLRRKSWRQVHVSVFYVLVLSFPSFSSVSSLSLSSLFLLC